MQLALDILSWILVGLGTFFCLVGGIGLNRFPDFYTRIHANGVTDTLGAGLLLTGQPFGFMAMLGFLSLSGMLIKNAIVLIDEINANKAEGKSAYDATVEAGLSRVRPVALGVARSLRSGS